MLYIVIVELLTVVSNSIINNSPDAIWISLLLKQVLANMLLALRIGTLLALLAAKPITPFTTLSLPTWLGLDYNSDVNVFAVISELVTKNLSDFSKFWDNLYNEVRWDKNSILDLLIHFTCDFRYISCWVVVFGYYLPLMVIFPQVRIKSIFLIFRSIYSIVNQRH
ncbi:MAG: hypothetical protein ACRC42_02380 [Mycoplasma sp.]